MRLRPLVLVLSLYRFSHARSIKYSVRYKQKMNTDYTPAPVFDWSTRRERESKSSVRVSCVLQLSERFVCAAWVGGRGRVGVGEGGGGGYDFFVFCFCHLASMRFSSHGGEDRDDPGRSMILLCVHCVPRADDDMYRVTRDFTLLILMWCQLVCFNTAVPSTSLLSRQCS